MPPPLSTPQPVWTTGKGKLCRVVDASGSTVRWLEFSNSGVHTFTFEEVYMDKHSSLPRQAILHDTQRDKFVRLSKDSMDWSNDCLAWQVVVFFGIVGGAIKWKGMEESKVLELKADDFGQVEELEQGSLPYFVDFYAPWCSHCRELMPIWEDLAEVTASHITVAKVDCEAEPKVLHSQGIQAFPTLMLYRPDTEPLTYQGARDLDSIVRWLQSNKVLPNKFDYDKEEYKRRAKERKRKKDAKKAAAAADDEDEDD